MKIAIVSDDEVNVSQHFGRAPYYIIVTIAEGKIVARETRSKAGHQTFAAHEPPKLAPGERHGYEAGAQARHESQVEDILDCQVLLAGGMGWGAYEAITGYEIETIITDVRDIDEAIELHLAGKLTNLVDRLH